MQNQNNSLNFFTPLLILYAFFNFFPILFVVDTLLNFCVFLVVFIFMLLVFILNKTSLAKMYLKIEIQNGTWITGYAGQEKTKLIAKKLNVATAKNADRHDYATTVIYDLSNGDYPLTALELEKIYGVNVIVDIPVTLSSSADFIIILGEN